MCQYLWSSKTAWKCRAGIRPVGRPTGWPSCQAWRCLCRPAPSRWGTCSRRSRSTAWASAELLRTSLSGKRWRTRQGFLIEYMQSRTKTHWSKILYHWNTWSIETTQSVLELDHIDIYSKASEDVNAQRTLFVTVQVSLVQHYSDVCHCGSLLKSYQSHIGYLTQTCDNLTCTTWCPLVICKNSKYQATSTFDFQEWLGSICDFAETLYLDNKRSG